MESVFIPSFSFIILSFKWFAFTLILMGCFHHFACFRQLSAAHQCHCQDPLRLSSVVWLNQDLSSISDNKFGVIARGSSEIF